jgi:hypothetical protein
LSVTVATPSRFSTKSIGSDMHSPSCVVLNDTDPVCQSDGAPASVPGRRAERAWSTLASATRPCGGPPGRHPARRPGLRLFLALEAHQRSRYSFRCLRRGGPRQRSALDVGAMRC